MGVGLFGSEIAGWRGVITSDIKSGKVGRQEANAMSHESEFLLRTSYPRGVARPIL